MKLLTHIDNKLRERYAPKNMDEVPIELADAFRKEGKGALTTQLVEAAILASIQTKYVERWRGIVAVIVVIVLALLVSFSPNVFRGNGNVTERFDDIANLVALLFVFVSVGSTLLLVILAPLPQKQRWIVRGFLTVLAIIFGLVLNSSETISVGTTFVGVGSVLLAIGVDLFTPKSTAVRKTKTEKKKMPGR